MRARPARLVALLLAFLVLSAIAAGAALAQAGQPWRDTSLSPDRRAQLLLDAMTLDQKLALVNGVESQPVPSSAFPPTGRSTDAAAS